MKTFFSLIFCFGLFCSFAQSYKVEIDEIPYDTLKEYQSMVLENIENDVIPPFSFDKEFDLDFSFPYFSEEYNSIILNSFPSVDFKGFNELEYPMQLFIVGSSFSAINDDFSNHPSDYRYLSTIVDGLKVFIMEYKNVTFSQNTDEIDMSFQYWFWENGNIEIRFGDIKYPEPYFKNGFGYWDDFSNRYYEILIFIVSKDLGEAISVSGNLNDNPEINDNVNIEEAIRGLTYLPKKNTVCRFKKQPSSLIDQKKYKLPTLLANQMIIPEDVVFNHFDIYDMTGRLVKSGNERQVDLSLLVNGNYVLKLTDGLGIYSYKFIKQ
jgi:hypothetical protein